MEDRGSAPKEKQGQAIRIYTRARRSTLFTFGREMFPFMADGASGKRLAPRPELQVRG